MCISKVIVFRCYYLLLIAAGSFAAPSANYHSSGYDTGHIRSSHDVHTRQSEDALCYEQDASLLPQANLHAQAALEKADGMYQTLQSLFMDTLSSCQSTVSICN